MVPRGDNPNPFTANRSLHPYQFAHNPTDIDTAFSVEFPDRNMEIKFHLLVSHQMQNLDLVKNTVLPMKVLNEFVTLLGENWMSFLVEFLDIEEHFLEELVLQDIHDEVANILKPIERLDELINLERNIKNAIRGVVIDESDIPKTTDVLFDSKSRIQFTMKQLFTKFVEKDGKSVKLAKKHLMQLVRNETTNILTTENRKNLAGILLYKNREVLLQKMRDFNHKYRLNVHDMSGKLSDLFQIHDEGESLTTS